MRIIFSRLVPRPQKRPLYYRSAYIAVNKISCYLHSVLQWRHNGHDSISNLQPHDCLLNRLFRTDQRKHQSSASLAFMRGIHRGPVNSPHKRPVTRKTFPFDDVIMALAPSEHQDSICHDVWLRAHSKNLMNPFKYSRCFYPITVIQYKCLVSQTTVKSTDLSTHVQAHNKGTMLLLCTSMVDAPHKGHRDVKNTSIAWCIPFPYLSSVTSDSRFSCRSGNAYDLRMLQTLPSVHIAELYVDGDLMQWLANTTYCTKNQQQFVGQFVLRKRRHTPTINHNLTVKCWKSSCQGLCNIYNYCVIMFCCVITYTGGFGRFPSLFH